MKANLPSLIALAGLPKPETEHQFWPGRCFRFDYAWPALMLALEYEGRSDARKGHGGRHTSYHGYTLDCEKYSEAALRGWRVIRVTREMVADGRALALLERVAKRFLPLRDS